jgi:hypothetical protein
MYYDGMGVKQDFKEAFLWMQKSAEADNTDAQYELARMYFIGIGVEPDSLMGNYWYEIWEENEYYNYWSW